MSFSPGNLEEFNSAEAGQVVALLTGLYGSPELAATVAAQRPFETVDELCAIARRAFDDMSDELVRASVHEHPPIGGAVAAGSLSEKEQQAAMKTVEGDTTDPGKASADEAGRDKAGCNKAMERIRELNPQYQDIFGHVFLIRASGLSAAEILEKMEERMTNDPDTEWAITREQLADINELRVRGLFA